MTEKAVGIVIERNMFDISPFDCFNGIKVPLNVRRNVGGIISIAEID